MSTIQTIASGYGFSVCAIPEEDLTPQKLAALIKLSPDLESVIEEDLGVTNLADVTVGDILEYEDTYGYSGLQAILCDVIATAEGIQICEADDIDDGEVLLYEPHYPWQKCGEKEMDLTEEKLKGIFLKYILMLTDKRVTVDYIDAQSYVD